MRRRPHPSRAHLEPTWNKFLLMGNRKQRPDKQTLKRRVRDRRNSSAKCDDAPRTHNPRTLSEPTRNKSLFAGNRKHYMGAIHIKRKINNAEHAKPQNMRQHPAAYPAHLWRHCEKNRICGKSKAQLGVQQHKKGALPRQIIRVFSSFDDDFDTLAPPATGAAREPK